MIRNILCVFLILLAFGARAQQAEVYKFERVLYTHQKDTASELKFDSLKSTCGKFEFADIYIKKTTENKIPQTFLIVDRAIRLFVGYNIVYYKCVDITSRIPDDQNSYIFVESKDYYVIYKSSNSENINIGHMKDKYYHIEIYQIVTDR
jgi:hypothetical protein